MLVSLLGTHLGFSLHPWAAAAVWSRGQRAARGSVGAAPPRTPPAQLPVSAESHLLRAEPQADLRADGGMDLWGRRLLDGGASAYILLKCQAMDALSLLPSPCAFGGKNSLGPRPKLQAHLEQLGSPLEEKSCQLHTPLDPHLCWCLMDQLSADFN